MNRILASRLVRILSVGALLSIGLDAHAFDDNRRGFFVGLGFGAGLSVVEPRRDDVAQTAFEDNRLGIDFLIGYAPGESLMLQLGSKGAPVTVGATDATLLIAGFGARVHPFRSAPSIYLTGLYGEGSLTDEQTRERARDDEDIAPSGPAAVVGIGMELYPHLYFEASHMRATLTSPLDSSLTFDAAQSLFTLGWVWY